MLILSSAMGCSEYTGTENVSLGVPTPPPPPLGPLYFVICLTAGVVVPALRRSKILDISTLEEDPGAAQEFARSKASARKEGLTGVQFADIAVRGEGWSWGSSWKDWAGARADVCARALVHAVGAVVHG